MLHTSLLVRKIETYELKRLHFFFHCCICNIVMFEKNYLFLLRYFCKNYSPLKWYCLFYMYKNNFKSFDCYNVSAIRFSRTLTLASWDVQYEHVFYGTCICARATSTPGKIYKYFETFFRVTKFFSLFFPSFSSWNYKKKKKWNKIAHNDDNATLRW